MNISRYVKNTVRMPLPICLALAAVAVITFSAPASGQNCELLVKNGIYDYDFTTIDRYHFKSFVNWYRSHKLENSRDARQRGWNFSYTRGLTESADGGHTSSDEAVREFNEDIEEYAAGTDTNEESLFRTAQTINPSVVAGLTACLMQKGFHAWLETTDNPEEFKLAVVFNSPGIPRTSMIKSVRYGRGVSCPNPTIYSRLWVDGSEVRTICTRARSTSAATIVVNAQNTGPGLGNLTLPGIPPAAPTPPPRFTTVEAVLENAGQQVSGGTCLKSARIEGGQSVNVWVTGSWDISGGGIPGRTGVGTLDAALPTTIHLFDIKLDRELDIRIPYKHPNTISHPNPYNICVDYPSRRGRTLNVHDSIILKIADPRPERIKK